MPPDDKDHRLPDVGVAAPPNAPNPAAGVLALPAQAAPLAPPVIHDGADLYSPLQNETLAEYKLQQATLKALVAARHHEHEPAEQLFDLANLGTDGLLTSAAIGLDIALVALLANVISAAYAAGGHEEPVWLPAAAVLIVWDVASAILTHATVQRHRINLAKIAIDGRPGAKSSPDYDLPVWPRLKVILGYALLVVSTTAKIAGFLLFVGSSGSVWSTPLSLYGVPILYIIIAALHLRYTPWFVHGIMIARGHMKADRRLAREGNEQVALGAPVTLTTSLQSSQPSLVSPAGWHVCRWDQTNGNLILEVHGAVSNKHISQLLVPFTQDAALREAVRRLCIRSQLTAIGEALPQVLKMP